MKFEDDDDDFLFDDDDFLFEDVLEDMMSIIVKIKKIR